MEKILKNADVMHEALGHFDDYGELLAALGFALDYWAVESGVSAEEIDEGLERLLAAAKGAHAMFGLPTEKYKSLVKDDLFGVVFL